MELLSQAQKDTQIGEIDKTDCSSKSSKGRSYTLFGWGSEKAKDREVDKKIMGTGLMVMNARARAVAPSSLPWGIRKGNIH